MDAENWDGLLDACPHRAVITDRACGTLPLWWPFADSGATVAVIAFFADGQIEFQPLDRGEIVTRLRHGETLLVASMMRDILDKALRELALALAVPVGTA